MTDDGENEVASALKLGVPEPPVLTDLVSAVRRRAQRRRRSRIIVGAGVVVPISVVGLVVVPTLLRTTPASTRVARPAGALTTTPITGSSSALTPQNAEQVCRAALGTAVVSTAATTIGEVRGWTYGVPLPPSGSQPAAGVQPAKDAFIGEGAAAFAAWCWTGQVGDWVSWAVDARGQKVRMAEITGATKNSPPTGGPAIP
jgi:hypothetical protein